MSNLYEYGGVDNCSVCKAKDVPVMEYYTGGFKCFKCAGVGESECKICEGNIAFCADCQEGDS